MDYIYITNNSKVGAALVRGGVRWIMIDLERIGKLSRQLNRNTVISEHTIKDVGLMRNAFSDSNLLVRVNPMGSHTRNEIESVIGLGADALMLPFFKTSHEVEEFIQIINRRCKVFLLLETLEAISAIEDILILPGIDYIHVGLNDLHIQRNTKFMFEFFSDGLMDDVASKLLKNQLKFGIGGVSRYGTLKPPAERVLNEHKRLGSSGVILSRSFMKLNEYNNLQNFIDDFLLELSKLNSHLELVRHESREFFDANRRIFVSEVDSVVRNLGQCDER